MDKLELVMTADEARRLRHLLVTEITWKTSPNGKAAASIHDALCRAHRDLPYVYLNPQPLVLT